MDNGFKNLHSENTDNATASKLQNIASGHNINDMASNAGREVGNKIAGKSEEEKSGAEKQFDKVAEKGASTAITTATGGALSGPLADAAGALATQIAKKEVTKTIKIYLIIAGISSTIFLFLILFIISFLQLMSIDNVMNSIQESLNEFGANVSLTINKTINYLTGDGAVGTENEVYNNLMIQQYKLFTETGDNLGNLDSALISATLNYGKLIDASIWIDEDGTAEELTDSEVSATLGDSAVGFNAEDSESFYRWANIWVGNYLTLLPWNRGLTGALVSTKVTQSCTTEKPGWWENFSAQYIDPVAYYQNVFLGTVKDNVNDFFKGITFSWAYEANSTADITGNNWLFDSVLSSYYSSVIGFGFYQDDSYSDEFFGYSEDDSIISSEYVECLPEFVGYDEETNEAIYVDTYPVYTFEMVNDYTKYKAYLTEFFIPYMFLDCDNCSLKTKEWADGEKDQYIENIISEIFEQKDSYNMFADANVYDSSGNLVSGNASYGSSGNLTGEFSGTLVDIGFPLESNPYYDGSASNLGQCVWYVRSRAIEIISNLVADETAKAEAVALLNASYGNAKDWWNDTLRNAFGSSTDINAAKAGSIIVWGGNTQYGHVAIVEAVYDDGTMLISHGWRTKTSDGTWDYSTGWADVNVQTKVVDTDWISSYNGYTFLGYIYLLDEV
ncbi:MAG: CHAP domain-containing protein [Mycoplasmatota bacterium]